MRNKSKTKTKTRKVEEPTTANLLAELATIDEVEARLPDSADLEQELVPQWCELLLSIKRKSDWPINVTFPLRRHDGELLIEVLHSVLHPHAGGSILDGLWGELDKALDRIMKRVDAGEKPRNVDLGHARGLTTAIARMTNPTTPNEEAVKGEAMDRYRIRRGLPPLDDDEDE
jgi:hypothetical protein